MWSYTVTVCSVEIYNEVLRFSVFSSLLFVLLCCDGQFWIDWSFFKLNKLPLNN